VAYAGIREGVGEASIGEHMVQLPSRENLRSSAVGASEFTDDNCDGSLSRAPARRGRRPWYVGKLLVQEPAHLGLAQRSDTAGPQREEAGSQPMMREPRKSGSAIVARQPADNASLLWRHSRWSDSWHRGNAGRQGTCRTENRGSVSQAMNQARRVERRYMGCRRAPAVGAGCLDWERSDLCGGGSIVTVPAAINSKVFRRTASKNLVPNRDRMHFIGDGEEIPPGTQARLPPSHTVGRPIFIISSSGEQEFGKLA